MISLLSKIYNQAKDVFVKPKLRFRMCLCKNAYFLPFNIYAPVIWLTKDISYYLGSNKKCYRTQNILVKGIDNKYFLTNHKFSSEFVWRRDIRKKLKKYHLSWIKPCYTLPFFFKLTTYTLGEFLYLSVFALLAYSKIFGFAFSQYVQPSFIK